MIRDLGVVVDWDDDDWEAADVLLDLVPPDFDSFWANTSASSGLGS